MNARMHPITENQPIYPVLAPVVNYLSQGYIHKTFIPDMLLYYSAFFASAFSNI